MLVQLYVLTLRGYRIATWMMVKVKVIATVGGGVST